MKIARLRSFLLATAALSAGLLVAGRASAQINYVQNPSFEATQYPADSLNEVTGTTTDGWFYNQIGTTSYTHEYIINGNVQDLSGNYFGTTPYGSQYLGLNAIRNNSFHSIASQAVNGLTVGQTYMLTLYIANLDGATDPKIGLTIEPNATGTGTSQVSMIFTAPAGGPAGDGTINFVPESVTFTATSNVIDFNINNQSKTGVMGIDNVSLVAVPEPGPVAAVLMGTAGLATVVLRRRRAS